MGDPLKALQQELQNSIVAISRNKLPNFHGGAVGYLSFDCIRHFEPTTNVVELQDNLHIPEALFMIYSTVVVFDHFHCRVSVVTHMKFPDSASQDIEPMYQEACALLRSTVEIIQRPNVPLPLETSTYGQSPTLEAQYSSNVGRRGYETFVTKLKEHIVAGNIIQAVPSQRLSRSTSVHPFNLYRTLRSVNPSPYMFYLSCSSFFLIGASPECLMSASRLDSSPASPLRIVNHAIAGTTGRGRDQIEDDKLAEELQNSTKDRAEHVMLVDLARNDVNRVCDPASVRVDRLMTVDRFSHVQHLTSTVSGVLRPKSSRWDAFRSIFPAGTVSGAPKVRAIQLIAELERETRGPYAGALGWFAFDQAQCGQLVEGAVDTCIAIRTMLAKEGFVHLQAGGGIVHESDEFEEWMETMRKLGSNLRCIELAEQRFEGKSNGKSLQNIIQELK